MDYNLSDDGHSQCTYLLSVIGNLRQLRIYVNGFHSGVLKNADLVGVWT
jgi:hypothetical protein